MNPVHSWKSHCFNLHVPGSSRCIFLSIFSANPRSRSSSNAIPVQNISLNSATLDNISFIFHHELSPSKYSYPTTSRHALPICEFPITTLKKRFSYCSKVTVWNRRTCQDLQPAILRMRTSVCRCEVWLHTLVTSSTRMFGSSSGLGRWSRK